MIIIFYTREANTWEDIIIHLKIIFSNLLIQFDSKYIYFFTISIRELSKDERKYYLQYLAWRPAQLELETNQIKHLNICFQISNQRTSEMTYFTWQNVLSAVAWIKIKSRVPGVLHSSLQSSGNNNPPRQDPGGRTNLRCWVVNMIFQVSCRSRTAVSGGEAHLPSYWSCPGAFTNLKRAPGHHGEDQKWWKRHGYWMWLEIRCDGFGSTLSDSFYFLHSNSDCGPPDNCAPRYSDLMELFSSHLDC